MPILAIQSTSTHIHVDGSWIDSVSIFREYLSVFVFLFEILLNNSDACSSFVSCSTNFPRTAKSRINRRNFGMASGASLIRSKCCSNCSGFMRWFLTIIMGSTFKSSSFRHTLWGTSGMPESSLQGCKTCLARLPVIASLQPGSRHPLERASESLPGRRDWLSYG